jgi:hypothetical protein
MKSPREMLLSRHAAIKPKLDALSQSALDAFARKERPRLISRLSEWLWPSPLAWASVAAAWIVVLALNAAVADLRNVPLVAGNPTDPATKEALQTQRALYAELVREEPTKAASLPRPRSDKSSDRKSANT